jgi:hemin uptake protein HemP
VTGSPAGLPGPRRLSSVELLQGADEVLIEHDGACYRLRRTALGRLILTK